MLAIVFSPTRQFKDALNSANTLIPAKPYRSFSDLRKQTSPGE